ncbi:MAG: hypothetical protein QG567_698 [Campylobacterota bacterium]|nr:hypothetical protein [Campylobacterota bacterium]
MVKIICEGKSDKNLISNFMDFLGYEGCYSDDNFIIMGNKSNIFKIDDPKYKTLLELIKADKISKILFVVDADYEKDNNGYGGYDNTKREMLSLIQKLQIDSISDYFISCDPATQDGYLESLLLSTVDKNLKNCYDGFLDCIEFPDKNHHKYIMEQLHRITSPNKPYDFAHQNFDVFKMKLEGILSNE